MLITYTNFSKASQQIKEAIECFEDDMVMDDSMVG